MAVAVDKTFVPATMPELKNADARELGIRVFRPSFSRSSRLHY
jgi:hypothetical protein